MNLDLRIPMGLMFLIVGAIMSIFGFFTRGSVIYERSVGMNINLIWGLVMLVFGLLMFLLAAGLTLTFGIMDLVNLAHGSLYMEIGRAHV